METINTQTPGRFTRLTAWMPLLWLSLAFIAGILFAGRVPLSVLVWLILAGIGLIVFILLRILHRRVPFSWGQPATNPRFPGWMLITSHGTTTGNMKSLLRAASPNRPMNAIRTRIYVSM
jgi:hypothetical protein